MNLRQHIQKRLPRFLVRQIRLARDRMRGSIRHNHLAALEALESTIAELRGASLPSDSRRTGLMADLIGTSPAQAILMLHLLHESFGSPGDVCEFGIAQGATSSLLANELRGTARSLWLYDSFAGLPAPTCEDRLIDDPLGLGAIEHYESTMRYSKADATGRLDAIGADPARIHVVAGPVERTLSESGNLPDQIAFAFIDMDFYEPISTTLEAIHDRVPPGGTVVVDDYRHFSSGVERAVERFIRSCPQTYELTHPPAWAGKFVVLRKREP